MASPDCSQEHLVSYKTVELPEGWLTVVEAETLAKLAEGKRVLELGAYKGRSTVALASSAAHVTSVDWHQGDTDTAKVNGPGYNTYPEFLENTKDFPNITPIVARTEEVAPLLAGQTFDMVWIDAYHKFDAVQHDFKLALSFSPEFITMHDWGLFDIEPAITALGYAPNYVVETVAVFDLKNLRRIDSTRTPEPHMLKLIVGMPFSGRYVSPEWALSMMNLRYPRNTRHGQFATKGLKREEARIKLVEKAIAENAEYLLFIDDDTAPPFDTVSQLMRELDTAGKDVMVCGGIYTTKTEPIEPLVFLDQGSGPHWNWKFGDVFQCWGLGTGCMMIRTEVFKHISKPWFRDIDSIEDVGSDTQVFGKDGKPDTFYMTDDLYFCQKVNDAGFKILAHGGVLPVHWDQKGRGHVLPDDAYPVKDVPPGVLWYKSYYEKKG